jgi:thiol-disulfide isomerase/thioredoxin
MFYAPWCGHCQSSKPEFDQSLGGIACDYKDYLAGKCRKHNGKVALIKVNGDEHPEVMKSHGVQGFPTFKYIKNVNSNDLSGTPIEYSGGRNKNEFENFVQGNNVENFANPSEHAFVMFYAPWCPHCKSAEPQFDNTLENIAVDYDDYISGNYKKYNGNIALIKVNGDKHPKLMEIHGVEGFPSFKLVKNVNNKENLEGDYINYNDARNSKSFTNFIVKENSLSHEGFTNYQPIEKFEDYRLDYDYSQDSTLFN